MGRKLVQCLFYWEIWRAITGQITQPFDIEVFVVMGIGLVIMLVDVMKDFVDAYRKSFW